MSELLKKLGIHEFSEDIRGFDATQLREHFSAKSGRIIMARLLRNVIWQAHGLITSGAEASLGGNLRTFWYRWVKPIMSRIEDDDKLSTDVYDLMLDAFSEMVLEHKLLHYRDFDFTDENFDSRLIGSLRPDILLFAEKNGWKRFLKRAHKLTGVSTLALGGSPSVLTSEYTLDALKPHLVGKTLHLVGIVDYDPSGSIIAHAFERQLNQFGAKDTTLTLMIHPEHYSARELELLSVDLPKGQKTKTAQWLEKTQGVNGKALGLEAESMPWPRLEELLKMKLNSLKLSA